MSALRVVNNNLKGEETLVRVWSVPCRLLKSRRLDWLAQEFKTQWWIEKFFDLTQRNQWTIDIKMRIYISSRFNSKTNYSRPHQSSLLIRVNHHTFSLWEVDHHPTDQLHFLLALGKCRTTHFERGLAWRQCLLFLTLETSWGLNLPWTWERRQRTLVGALLAGKASWMHPWGLLPLMSWQGLGMGEGHLWDPMVKVRPVQVRQDLDQGSFLQLEMEQRRSCRLGKGALVTSYWRRRGRRKLGGGKKRIRRR